MPAESITTAGLRLRRWRKSDREPFSLLNADARVMEFMPNALSRDESDALADKIEMHFQKYGFGLYAAEHVPDRVFIGFIGLSVPTFEAHFTPCVEIGWRLAADYWGRRLATEGARAVVGHAFETIGVNELVSFTVPANIRSRRVMEKLGMKRDPADDFDHPRLPKDHPMSHHILYRLNRTEWEHKR